MNRVVAVLSSFLLVAVGLVASPAAAADDPLKATVDRIVGKTDSKLLEVVVTKTGADGKPSFDVIKVPDVAGARQVVEQWQGKAGVTSVEMNQLRLPADFNDPYYQYQWALKPAASPPRLWAQKVYGIVRNDRTIPVVAVVDTGVRLDHPDLAGRILTGYNVDGGSADDQCGHGTHVAGIIAANPNNGIGGMGLALRAKILPVKFLSTGLLGTGDCAGTAAGSAEAIMWAASHGATVINASYTGTYSDAEAAAVNWAVRHGVMVVAAAGNTGKSGVAYPAAYPGVVGVAAVDSYGRRASFSTTGGHVDVAAPGVHIWSTMRQSNTLGCGAVDYCRLNGTSMATPFVAASAAMAMVHCRWTANTTANYLRSRAKRSAGTTYPNPSTGYGLLNTVALLGC